MKRSIHLFTGITTLLLLTGCMGYQLGGTRPEGIETVYMAPVVNTTTEPAIELQVTKALRQRLQFDGRLKLKNVLDVTILVLVEAEKNTNNATEEVVTYN